MKEKERNSQERGQGEEDRDVELLRERVKELLREREQWKAEGGRGEEEAMRRRI